MIKIMKKETWKSPKLLNVLIEIFLKNTLINIMKNLYFASRGSKKIIKLVMQYSFTLILYYFCVYWKITTEIKYNTTFIFEWKYYSCLTICRCNFFCHCTGNNKLGMHVIFILVLLKILFSVLIYYNTIMAFLYFIFFV